MTDIYSRLLRDRIIFIGTPIDDGVANVVVAQLLHLAALHPATGPAPSHSSRRRRPCVRYGGCPHLDDTG